MIGSATLHTAHCVNRTDHLLLADNNIVEQAFKLRRHPRIDQGRVGLFENAEQRQPGLGRHNVLSLGNQESLFLQPADDLRSCRRRANALGLLQALPQNLIVNKAPGILHRFDQSAFVVTRRWSGLLVLDFRIVQLRSLAVAQRRQYRLVAPSSAGCQSGKARASRERWADGRRRGSQVPRATESRSGPSRLGDAARPCAAFRRQSNASSRATAERGAPVPCQFHLSSWKLDQAAPGDCPRSSGIRASFIRASASSSPTCRARPIGLSPSTTSAGHASNGSRKARARSSGRGYRAERLWPTPCGSSFMRSLTISAISCARCDARANPGLIADELKEKLIKIGAKVVSHGRYVAFQMAEVAIPRQMFQEILDDRGTTTQPPPASASDADSSRIQKHRREDYVQMPPKIARSTPRPSLTLSYRSSTKEWTTRPKGPFGRRLRGGICHPFSLTPSRPRKRPSTVGATVMPIANHIYLSPTASTISASWSTSFSTRRADARHDWTP